MPALAIYLRSDDLGQRNLEHAIRTGVWGFTEDRAHYPDVGRGTTVLIGTQFRHPRLGGSPRRPLDIWVEGELGRVAVFRAESSIRRESFLLRPDEVESGELRYPYRLAIKPIGNRSDVSLAALPDELVDAFRISALRRGGAEQVADSDELASFVHGSDGGRRIEA